MNDFMRLLSEKCMQKITQRYNWKFASTNKAVVAPYLIWLYCDTHVCWKKKKEREKKPNKTIRLISLKVIANLLRITNIFSYSIVNLMQFFIWYVQHFQSNEPFWISIFDFYFIKNNTKYWSIFWMWRNLLLMRPWSNTDWLVPIQSIRWRQAVRRYTNTCERH